MTEVRIPTTASFSVRGLFERRRFSTIAIDPKKAPARQPIPQLKGPEMAQKIEALARLDSERLGEAQTFRFDLGDTGG